MKFSQNLNIAVKAALEAGEAILKVYNEEDFEVDFKADNSPLTTADKVSHNIIMKHLTKTEIPVLSEEGRDIPYSERENWNELWIVDPIDGTKEFIKRNGEFTVNIALIKNHIPILGVIYVPVLKELYIAEENFGAYKLFDVDKYENDLFNVDWKSLPIDQPDRPFRVVASKSHLSPETQEFINDLSKEHANLETISKGSSLKLCMVAEGTADYYPRFAPTMEWDTAAGQAICMYAGKTVTDYITKKPMVYNREKLLNNWFLVK